MEIFIWLLCAGGACAIAAHKGRSGFGWFCLGILFGPLAFLVAALPSADAKAEQDARTYGTARGFRRCRVCAEAIREAAVKCRYCHTDVTP